MDIAKLYESKQEEIMLLSAERRLDILHMYIESLFELRDFYKMKKEVDVLLYLSLSEEIPVEYGKLYYEDALFWKAKASLELMEYDESQHILEQLRKINPKKKEYRSTLLKCLFKNKPDYVRTFRAITILLFLVAAIVILFEILIIQSFFMEILDYVRYFRNGLFFSALGLVGMTEIVYWLYCEWSVMRT